MEPPIELSECVIVSGVGDSRRVYSFVQNL